MKRPPPPPSPTEEKKRKKNLAKADIKFFANKLYNTETEDGLKKYLLLLFSYHDHATQGYVMSSIML